MAILVLGLVLFLGMHSVRIVGDGWRTQTVARLGGKAWKGLYTVVSLVGFALVCWGYARARQELVVLWSPPRGMNHAAALLMVVSFVLLVATYVPGNAIKAKVHHPMVLSVKVWAFAHLLANGNLADVVLFGAFLVWAIADYASSRRRDRANGITYAAGRAGPTVVTVAVGLVAWGVFAFWAHRWLIGVSPMGM